MISCTEFIPLYSEFFKFLEKRDGHDAVVEYWKYLSKTSIGDKTNPNSLAYKCDRLGGFEGAVAYWGHTLTEEACDFFKAINREKKIIFSHMRHCPSRGMLNDLKHVTPYHDYCSHCNIIYSLVLEKYGITYERDNSNISRAECCSILYDTQNPPDFDFRKISDEEAKALLGENTEIIDLKTEDNKYLHRDFHLIGDNALKYCGEKYGDAAVVEFVTAFAKYYFAPVIEKIKEVGLSAIEEWIKGVYEIEEASELLNTELSANRLAVTVVKSPVIEYMHSLNQAPSEYYIEETRTLYKAIAEECGYTFTLEYYNEDGGAKFIFQTGCRIKGAKK